MISLAGFWEARLLWGQVKAAVRKMALTALTTVQPTEPQVSLLPSNQPTHRHGSIDLPTTTTISSQRAAHLLALLTAFPLALARVCTGSTEPLPPRIAALLPAGTPSEAAAVALCLQLQLCMAEFCVRWWPPSNQLPSTHAVHTLMC